MRASTLDESAAVRPPQGGGVGRRSRVPSPLPPLPLQAATTGLLLHTFLHVRACNSRCGTNGRTEEPVGP